MVGVDEGAPGNRPVDIGGEAAGREGGICLKKGRVPPADENHAGGEVAQIRRDGGHAVNSWTAWGRHAAEATSLCRIASRASFRSRTRPTRSASTSAKLSYRLGQRRGSSAARG